MKKPAWIREAVDLTSFTTMRVQSLAAYVAEVSDVAALQEALRFGAAAKLPLLVLGGGSNVVLPDDGFAGLVIIMKDASWYAAETDDSVLVQVGAGFLWDDLVTLAAESGWWGIENMAAIPGSVGATPVQNVGAYGADVSSVIESVIAIDIETLEEKTFTNEECQFGYRDSFFKSAAGARYIITSVIFRLSLTPRPNLSYQDLASYFADKPAPDLLTIVAAVRAIRAAKFPDLSRVGTAGSFFKNPVLSPTAHAAVLEMFPDVPSHKTDDGQYKVSAAWLIDKVAGMRGVSNGAVGTYEGQALVLVNHGGATASEIDAFAASIEDAVCTKTGIRLEREVRFVG